MAQIEMLNEFYRNFSPSFNHARQQVCLAQVQGCVKSNRQVEGRRGRFCCLLFGKMSFRDRHARVKNADLLHVDTVQGKEVFSFSICVSHGPDTRNSLLPSASAMSLLKSATSRVVIPSLLRTSFSRSPGSIAVPSALERLRCRRQR